MKQHCSFLFCALFMYAYFMFNNLSASLVPITTSITKPTCVAFLQGNKIVINNKNQLEMIDLATNTTLLSTHYCDDNENAPDSDLAICSDKTCFAFSCNGVIRAYNNHGQEEHLFDTRKLDYVPMSFDCCNKLLVFLDRNTDISGNTVDLFDLRHCPRNGPADEEWYPIACNPQEKDTFVRLFNQPSGCTVSYTSPHESFANSSYSRNHSNKIVNEIVFDAQFNPSGTDLLINHAEKGIWIKFSDTIYLNNTSFSGAGFPYASMHIYSHNIIALLSCTNAIEYWNYTTLPELLLIDTCLQDKDEPITHIKRTKRLSFSPDKNKLLVALQNKCFIIPVPFYVKYMPETVQELFPFFSLLTQLSQAPSKKGKLHEIYLPKETIMIIIEKMLPSHERP